MNTIAGAFGLRLLCGIGLLTGWAVASSAQGTPTSKQLFHSSLQGIPGQQAIMNVVDFAPGTSVPWHMHPEGHELLYVVEGQLTVEDENQKKITVKAGDVNHVLPNVAHTARNDSGTATKVLVVRIKNESKPTLVSVQR